MRRYRQAPEDRIKILKPKILNLSLRNKYNKLNPPQEHSILVPPPSLTDIGLRTLLQRLQSPVINEFIIALPNVLEVHQENFLFTYDNQDIDELRVNTPEFLWAELKNVMTSYTHRDDILEIGLPDGIEIGGSVKPVLTFPVLRSIEYSDTESIMLLWNDTSRTHTGYTIYKSLDPIPVDTTQEPYVHLGPNVKHFFDYDDIPPNTPIYYRVTPKSVYGNFFSNQVEITRHAPDIVDPDDIIYFMVQESPTYIPIRADNNIIPLVPIINTKWDELNARFEQFSVIDSTLTSEYIPALLDINLWIYGVNTSNLIYFMMQESSTYIPLRVDNNIIPLVSAINTEWDGLNAGFEQMDALDTSLTSDYTPTPLDIEMRTYTANLITFMLQDNPTYIPLRVGNNIIPLVPTTDTMWSELNASFEQLAVIDADIVSEYTPTPLNVEMRTYDE